MNVITEHRVEKAVIELDGDEARQLYAELYRLGADGRVPGPLDGMLRDLCRELGAAGLDS